MTEPESTLDLRPEEGTPLYQCLKFGLDREPSVPAGTHMWHKASIWLMVTWEDATPDQVVLTDRASGVTRTLTDAQFAGLAKIITWMGEATTGGPTPVEDLTEER